MQLNLVTKNGIGKKIAWLVAFSVFSAMVILASFLMIKQTEDAISAKQKSVEAVGYVFAAAMAENIEGENRLEIQRVLRSMARIPSIVHAAAFGKNNDKIAEMGNTVVLQSDLVGSNTSKWQFLSKGRLPVAVDIVRGGVSVGKLILIADISDIRQNLLSTLLSTLLASLVAAGLAVPLSRPLQKKISAPIVRLTSSIQQVRETRKFQAAEVPDAEGETLVLVETFNSMITDINSRDQALQKLAYYDPLTGLPNRVNFQHHLEKILQNITISGGCAVYMLDIDNFHAINDAMGHSIGDALLMNVAALLQHESDDAFVARLGGDEFAICIPNINTLEEGQYALAKFVASLYLPINIVGNELHLSAAVGAVLLPQDGKTSTDVQRNLDLALHAAKQLGPGRVYFYQAELSEILVEEAELVKGLRTALQNNGLEVHYQPIVKLDSGTVEGFEALVRWKHPERGMISPTKFIPLAEKSGLISKLGDWVLNTACQEAKAWLDQGQPARIVAVNISAAQMLQSDFMDKVSLALATSKLPPHLLCLELTESLFVGKSMITVQKLLTELKALGIQTALDDFGTGYSSLSYLENLPFDKLKIDRAFVLGLAKGKKNIDLMQGIVDLAHALGMAVVAEGAEIGEEVETLRKLGADSVQGYFFAKPAPAQIAVANANQIDDNASKLHKSG